MNETGGDMHIQEGKMFYLTIHLWLYGVWHMVKDHSDGDIGHPVPPLGLQEQEIFYMHHPTNRIAYTMALVNSVVEQMRNFCTMGPT